MLFNSKVFHKLYPRFCLCFRCPDAQVGLPIRSSRNSPCAHAVFCWNGPFDLLLLCPCMAVIICSLSLCLCLCSVSLLCVCATTPPAHAIMISINQSLKINQSINQSILSQSINQSSVNQLISQSVNLSIIVNSQYNYCFWSLLWWYCRIWVVCHCCVIVFSWPIIVFDILGKRESEQ